MLRGADAVVAISEAIAREAVEAGFAAGKVHLIPHGIDMSEYAPVRDEEKRARRAALGLPADRTLITYAGRLIEGKGLETLFAAMRTLADLPAWHLLMVGSGSGQVISIEERLRKDAETGALRGRVTFTGRVENVAACLQASDIFAFPTLDEALGMSAVEAQACGLPVIASRTGGVPDIVEDGVTGLLVSPGEPGPLAEGLRLLLSDPGLNERFATAARRRAEERFAFSTMATRYAGLFRSLTASRAAA
jgi:D-inositol-3-phosphate glycosyltransferase